MNPEKKQEMLRSAPIPGLVTRLAVPTVISMLVTTFYNLADSFFVGQLESNSAQAAVGVVFPLMAIIQALGFFFGHGSGNAISRHLGAGDMHSAGSLASCGFFSALGAGLLVMLLGQLFLEPLALLLGSTETILPYAKPYLRIILLGAPYMTASLVLNNQMRFQGNALFSMIGITSGAVLNLVLDPLLIFHFEMGISGAAWATILSQLCSFLLLLGGIKWAKCVPLDIRKLRYLPQLMGEIFKGGLPSLVRQGLSSLSIVVLNWAARPFGDGAIAAMSVVLRLNNFANSAVIGFGQGFQPVCGFNYGVGNKARVREAFWFSVKVASICLVFTAAAGFVFSEELIGLFREGDPEVVPIGALALRLQCLALPLSGWVIMNNMLFQTCKITVPASILAAARQGIFFLPPLLILPPLLGMLGVQLSLPISELCSFLLALYYNRKLLNKL
ncbi:MAG: MATE family efflux transporter [Firmicutes bacterium]|nr:MATE family efflux transporter [Bacillota bacterium]